jgi:hypothetical protein
MNGNIYMDGIANVTLVDGVVRYDLITMTPTNEAGKFNIVPVAPVSTSLQGMIRTYDEMSKAINVLVERGILTKHHTPQTASRQRPPVI